MNKDIAALESGNNKGFNKPNYKKKPQKQFRETYQHTQMEEQLGALYNLTRGREGYSRDLESLGVEGVDHINVSRYSDNRLGFLLAPSTKLSFKLFGRSFSTIENLMLFYRSWCTNNILPTADFNTCSEIRTNELTKFPHFANIYVVVCLGYVSIFKKLPTLLKAMEQNTLVLDSYKTQNGQRVRPNTSVILVRAINEAFSAVSENRQPNLSVFMNREQVNEMRHFYNELPYKEGFTLNHFIEDSFSIKNILAFYNREYVEKEEEPVEKIEEEAKVAEEAPVTVDESTGDASNDEALAQLDPNPDAGKTEEVLKEVEEVATQQESEIQ